MMSRSPPGRCRFELPHSPRNDRREEASLSALLHCILHAQYRAMLLVPGAPGDEIADVHAPSDSRASAAFAPDSRQAWVRLALALLIGSIGSVGMWSVVVVLPVIQACLLYTSPSPRDRQK